MNQLKYWIFFVGLSGISMQIEAQTATFSDNVFADEEQSLIWRNSYFNMETQVDPALVDMPVRDFLGQVRLLHMSLQNHFRDNGFTWGDAGQGAINYTMFINADGKIALFAFDVLNPTDFSAAQRRQLESLMNSGIESVSPNLRVKMPVSYSGVMGFNN